MGGVYKVQMKPSAKVRLDEAMAPPVHESRLRSYSASLPPPPPRGGFGERLNEALRRRGVRKIYPLALELGVDESALSRWRKGGAISLDSAIRLAEQLDVSLDWLLIGRGNMDSHKLIPPLTVEDESLLEALRTARNRLPSQAVARLIEFMQSV